MSDKPLLVTKRMKKQGIRISQAMLSLEQAAGELSISSLDDEYLWIIHIKKKLAFVIFLKHFFKDRPYNYDRSVVSRGLQKPVHKASIDFGKFF